MNKHSQYKKRSQISLMVSSLLLNGLLISSANADIVNGNFENGLTGWTRSVFGSAIPITTASGITDTDAGRINPSLTSDQYIYTSQTGQGLSILSQPFMVKSGTNKLFFDFAINNAAGDFHTPDSFNYSGAANQQARFDILKPGSDPTVYNASDVIVTGFKTESGDPFSSDWTTSEIDLTADLVSYVGQEVILRFWQEDNLGYFNLALDNINVGWAQFLRSLTYLELTIADGGKSNAQHAASALDTIHNGTSPASMTSFFSGLDGLNINAGVAKAIESTIPMVTHAGYTASMHTMGGIQSIVSEMQFYRTAGLDMRSLNAGDITSQEQDVWIKMYGGKGSQDGQDGINGFNMHNVGIGIGYECEIKDKSHLGVAGFYNYINTDMKNMNQSADLNAYSLLVYGNTYLKNFGDLLFQVGYSYQDTDTSRTVIAGNYVQTFTANYAPEIYSADVKWMKAFTPIEKFTVRPMAELTYRYFDSPAYTESGLDGMALMVQNFDNEQFIVGGGVLMDYQLGSNSKLISNLNIGYDTQHNKNTVTASYLGSPVVAFETNGIDNGGWIYDIGVGALITDKFGGHLELTYHYTGEGNTFYNNVFSTKYTWKF